MTILFKPIIAIFACLVLQAPVMATQKEGPIGKVNINTATRTELIQIPKVGEKMADRIIAFRKANGPFTRIEELMNVKGMGEKTFLSIRGHLTVGNQRQGSGAAQPAKPLATQSGATGGSR